MSSDAPLFEHVRGFHWSKMQREFGALSRLMLDSPPNLLRQEYTHYFLWELAPERMLRALRAVRHRLGRDRRPPWFTPAFRELAYRRSQQQRRAAGPFAGKHAEFVHRCFVPTHRLNMIEEWNKLSAAHGLERAYPFMDRDLVAFMMAIPGEVVTWQGTYKGLFREAMRSVLPESIRRRAWKADFTAVANAAAAEGYSRFVSHFESGCLSAAMGYLDRDMFATQFEGYRVRLTGESFSRPPR